MTKKSCPDLFAMDDRSEEDEWKPLPTNLEDYLPWACEQYQLSYNMVIRVERKQPYDRKPSRQANKMRELILLNGANVSNNSQVQISAIDKVDSELLEDTIVITATYDGQDKLAQLKIGGCSLKPRKLLQVLSHILPYHRFLTTLIIEPQIDKYTNYEIGNILVNNSNISEFILDGCFIEEANFYSLLEGNLINLKRLSLARCGITDCALQKITTCLIYPSQASKVLSILNLSSNKITDEGAGHMAQMLRSNTQLYYLNLADNAITDIGAKIILNTLIEFEISYDEWHNYKVRYMEYVKQKVYNEKLQVSKPEVKQVYIKSKFSKKPQNDVQTENSKKYIFPQKESLADDFTDPFHNWYTVDDKVYNCGNHYLQCLNLAYNKITYSILDKIVQVLSFQTELNEKPRGLVNLNLEGNLLPKFCVEYAKIEEYISDAVECQTVPKDNKRKTTDCAKFKL